MKTRLVLAATVLTLPVLRPQTLVNGRPSVVLDGKAGRVVVDLYGGSIIEFRLTGQELNPLRWNEKGPVEERRPMGHFLCLDRWGQPSEAERRNGMPFHGEASRAEWKVLAASGLAARMSATLPMAGLEVERAIRMHETEAVFVVEEAVTNRNPLGRVYNMVQHPTIGPPFLEESTVVDSNARKGFMQSSPLPDPEEPAVFWPQALKDGQPVNLRMLTNDPAPNVVSYVIEEDIGWTTASSPARGLLLGYAWKRADYPWFNAWRHVENGRPLARGLEFGTTGLHQPFPVLVRKGSIFGRPLFDYLDAGQTATRSYVAFLCKIPAGYTGVARVSLERERLVVHGRDGSTLSVGGGELLSAVRP